MVQRDQSKVESEKYEIHDFILKKERIFIGILWNDHAKIIICYCADTNGCLESLSKYFFVEFNHKNKKIFHNLTKNIAKYE